MIGRDALRPAGLVEVEDPVHVAVVGDRQRRLAVGGGGGHDLGDAGRAVEHRELGVLCGGGRRMLGGRPRRARSVYVPLPVHPLSTGIFHSCGRVTALSFGLTLTIRAPPPATGLRELLPLRGRCRAGARLPSRGAGGKTPLAHLLELAAGGHLLGEQRRLDAVEEALQPADELRLGDSELGIARDVRLEGERQPVELGGEVRRQPAGELPDGGLVDLLHAHPAGGVEGRMAHLVEQLLDHRADPHDLGRLLDRVEHLRRRPICFARYDHLHRAGGGLARRRAAALFGHDATLGPAMGP